MPTIRPAINPLSVMAKFVYNQLYTNSNWNALNPVPFFYEEFTPVGVKLVNPAAMFCLKNPKTVRGAFGYTLFSCDNYEITAVVEGPDFSLIEPLANIIATTFDWQYQLIDSNGNPTLDPTVGRPKTQQLWTDPDNTLVQLMIMGMVLDRPVKYSFFIDGVNYIKLGAVYEIQYYVLDTPM